jgi:ABC-type sugar transport system ATPase subunit
LPDDNIVEMKGISKRFGQVQALNRVDLELHRGEIMGLVGDNAAGKSTLMKILGGAVAADEGDIFVDGRKATIRNPADAHNLGIEMIYQDLALFNNLDVCANVYIGRELTRKFLGIKILDKPNMRSGARELVQRLNIDIRSPDLLVEEMSGGQRQMVACARAIAFQRKVLIMDEPTAALGVKEANTLLGHIEELKNQGLSIIMITQRVPDVLAIGDRVMVLKQGERQGVLDVDKCTLNDIVELIIKGREGRGTQDEEVEIRSV